MGGTSLGYSVQSSVGGSNLMSLPQYKYTGADRRLIGHTALGQQRLGGFCVQVDEFTHMWSHGWHTTDQNDWEIIDEEG
jgi:hypothetical protein